LLHFRNQFVFDFCTILLWQKAKTQHTQQQAINLYSPVECDAVYFGIYRVILKKIIMLNGRKVKGYKL
jgi:hypothetical protein